MRARVAGSIVLEALPASTLERLRRDLSFPNPAYTNALISGRSLFGIDDLLCCAQEIPNGLVIPRGAVSLVRSRLAEDGLVVPFEDERSKGDSLGTIRYKINPRPYQVEGAELVAKNVQGMVVLPCGGGKTTLGLHTISMIGRSALVIVDTVELLDQWEEAVQEKLGIQPGLIQDGKITLGRVTIAIIDTLLNMLDRLPSFGACFGTVILDEAHMAPANTCQRVLGILPGKYRLGLTATPEREDGLTKMVDWSFGPRLIERNAGDLIRDGWLVAPNVEVQPTSFVWKGPTKAARSLAKMEHALSLDEGRNRQIVELIGKDVQNGEHALVLTGRKEHSEILGSMLEAMGVRAASVTGDTARKKRKAMMADFKRGELRVLAATNLADQGLDVPSMTRMVLAYPAAAKGRTTQRVGRLMRPHEGSLPVLYDFVDVNVETLMRRWKARRSVYRSIGLPIFGDPVK